MTEIAERAVEREPVRPRERDAIIAALRVGEVPATGLHHLVVGRGSELEALASDLDAVARGGARCRAVVGPNGAGKTFLLAVLHRAALAKNLVATRVDLTPSHRLHSTGGHAQALYRAITAGLATRVRPEGGALPAVLERVVSAVVAKAVEEGRGPDRALR
ncbi:MAG: ATP-binding protein, partial [Actinomycetota bacterium]|nr:ATP-binding protein [Actinomycetota bacterium]